LKPPALVVRNQSLEGGTITVQSLYLDKPGFVVVHKDVNNTFGAVIGNSDLLQGEVNNAKVAVNTSQTGTRVWVMLHYDDNNNGLYEFPAEDAPIVINGNVLVTQIRIL